MPALLEQLDLLLLTVAQPYKVHPAGVHFQGLRYLDPVLAAVTVTRGQDRTHADRGPAETPFETQKGSARSLQPSPLPDANPGVERLFVSCRPSHLLVFRSHVPRSAQAMRMVWICSGVGSAGWSTRNWAAMRTRRSLTIMSW